MTFDYSFIRKTFSNWDNVNLDEIKGATIQRSEDSLLTRIQTITAKFKDSGTLESQPDFIVLIRQLLMKQKANGQPNDLMVPTEPCWPSRQEWEHFTFQVMVDGRHYKIQPRGWHPDWLCGPNRNDDIFYDLLTENTWPEASKSRMDPLLKQRTGYEYYASNHQRDAIRSMLCMPKGSTLIVNIPTGSGKTLIAQAPFLVDDRKQFPLTLVVVPTISLTIDLEERTKEILRRNNKSKWENHNFAYYSGVKGGQSTLGKIKDNIKAGRQGLLFVSPETVVLGLFASLFEACKKGLLSHFVVDEAHIICEWGGNFRCEYQILPGLRRGLLKHSEGEKFRTILMSATFTQQHLNTLEEIFGPKKDIQIVSSVTLRREPTYWSHFSDGYADKEDKIMQTLRHVPRPFILYTTKVEDANNYYNLLKNNGNYERLAKFHGRTTDTSREKIIRAWRSNEIDGVIATSAFGLGIDKEDVRSIIHGTLPETLDRFYQEVGRGGRDGKPSASITIYSKEDVATAEGLRRSGTIGVDKAYKRWRAMQRRAKQENENQEKLGNDLLAVDYTTVPDYGDQENEYNENWNLTVLNSMARSRLINIDFLPMDRIQRVLGEDEDEFNKRMEKRWETYKNSIFIKIINPALLKEEAFKKTIEKLWKKEDDSETRSLETLKKALTGGYEMGAALQELYTDRTRNIIVSRMCRGCPGEALVENHDVFTPSQSQIIDVIDSELNDNQDWKKLFYDETFTEIYIFYEIGENGDDLLKAIDRMISRFGVRHLSFSNKSFMKRVQEQLPQTRNSTCIFFDYPITNGNTLDRSAPPVPAVDIYFPQDGGTLPGFYNISSQQRLIIVPNNIESSASERPLMADNIKTKNLGYFH